EQFYLGATSSRNFAFTYSSLNTAIPPTIESTQPLSAATNVALNQPIIITFTKPMATIETQNAITISPEISNKNFIWSNSNLTLTISHDNFNANTTYTVTIGTAAQALDNTNLSSPYRFSFITGASASSTAPFVSINPIKNEDGTITNVTTDSTPTFTGIATDESGSTISNIEFRYASGSFSDWSPATALDGNFDSSIEAFTFTITPEVLRGEHSVEVRATNAAGITTTANFTTYTFWVISNRPEITLKANGSPILSGDPLNSSSSFEITVVTDRTLSQLWFTLDDKKTNILPANPSFVTKVITRETLSEGAHNIKVEAVDIDNQGTIRSTTKEVTNLLVQISGAVKVFGTPLNYPNPFNAGVENTNISYILSRASNITLTIHDLAGNLIAKKNFTANEEGGRAGYNEITWDGKSDAGEVVGNGIYVYLIVADGKLAGKGKLTVLKR
ncbi:MAG: Ig-like domain-containing protein, partial [Candidatus Margulisiibacteriota bacterium]